MTTKVKNTVSHKTSQEDVVLVKGKLIILCKDKPIYYNSRLISERAAYLKPIIILETEEIKVGDKYYSEYHNSIINCNYPNHAIGLNMQLKDKTIGDNGKRLILGKILSLPKHFSPKHLQAIVDGKLKDGDEVLVETMSFKDMPKDGEFSSNEYSIKLINNY